VKCIYLFLQTIPGGIVGAFITYAEGTLYSHYALASQRPWGIQIKTDQEIAGLMMWVGTNTLYLVLISVIFLRWAGKQEEEDERRLKERRIEANRIVATGGTIQH
jgi:cytochrome c oxidase assembly factor CtaG